MKLYKDIKDIEEVASIPGYSNDMSEEEITKNKERLNEHNIILIVFVTLIGVDNLFISYKRNLLLNLS